MKHWDTTRLLVDDPLSLALRTPDQRLKLVTNNNHIITLTNEELLIVWDCIGKVECVQCGYTWRPNVAMPQRCANRECNSRKWFKPDRVKTFV